MNTNKIFVDENKHEYMYINTVLDYESKEQCVNFKELSSNRLYVLHILVFRRLFIEYVEPEIEPVK